MLLQKACDPGIIINSELTMESHAANVVRNSSISCAMSGRTLTLDAPRTLATAFIASHLDYCNAILYGATM